MAETEVVLASDYEELADFLATFPGLEGRRDAWLARFRWWWEENPVFSEELLRGWLLREAGRIVGFMGAIPLRFQIQGAESIAFAGTTWRVLKEYRGQSLALKRAQMATRKNALQFSTTPKPDVAALLKVLGSREIGEWQTERFQSIIPLRTAKFIERRLGRTVIGKIATIALHPVAATYLHFKRRALRRSPTFDVRAVHRADGSFDDLWNRTKHLYENTNARGSRELAWYCAVGLGGEKLLLGCYDGERLTGYMLLLADRDGDTQFLRCIDLWLDPEAAPVETTRALLREAVAIAWKRRSDFIVLPHFHRRIAEIYEALGLIRRPAWARREFISGPKEFLSAMTIENTYFVGAQGDVGL